MFLIDAIVDFFGSIFTSTLLEPWIGTARERKLPKCAKPTAPRPFARYAQSMLSDLPHGEVVRVWLPEKRYRIRYAIIAEVSGGDVYVYKLVDSTDPAPGLRAVGSGMDVDFTAMFRAPSEAFAHTGRRLSQADYDRLSQRYGQTRG